MIFFICMKIRAPSLFNSYRGVEKNRSISLFILYIKTDAILILKRSIDRKGLFCPLWQGQYLNIRWLLEFSEAAKKVVYRSLWI